MYPYQISPAGSLNLAKAFFNVMLKKFGVQGVKVHEVVSLDTEILESLP